jgi:hypothetical protein
MPWLYNLPQQLHRASVRADRLRAVLWESCSYGLNAVAFGCSTRSRKSRARCVGHRHRLCRVRRRSVSFFGMVPAKLLAANGKKPSESCLFRWRIIFLGNTPKLPGSRMNSTEDQEWLRRLRSHNRKMLALIVAVFGVYIVALALLTAQLEAVLKSTGHWKS